MNILTHLGISREVMALTGKKLEIQLDTAGFMFGNIKPDIVPALSSIPHIKDKVNNFVKNEIKDLFTYKIKSDSNCTREFSERLGLVTHYISDFFCYAHSQYFEGNIFKHFYYESKLSQFCRSNGAEAWRKSAPIPLKGMDNYTSLCDYIDTMQKDYIQEGGCPSYMRDIRYTMETTITFCIAILNACSLEKVSHAA